MSTFPVLTNVEFINSKYPIQDNLPTIIELFATYCPPCRGQIPHIAKIAKDYADKLNVVAISAEETKTVETTVKRIPLLQTYNVAVDPNNTTKGLKALEGVNGIPHAFLFDKEKNLVWHGHPANLDEALSKVGL